MTRLFDQQAGTMTPVTVIDVSGNTFFRSKTPEKEGYSAVQVGYDDQRNSASTSRTSATSRRPAPRQVLRREFRVETGAALPEAHPGLETFTAGQWVDVIGDQGQGLPGCHQALWFRWPSRPTDP